jgi:hypothetical protein
MTIQDLKNNNLLLFEAITGSRAYGLEHEHSDTDIKGVFVMPKEHFYGFKYISQVNNATNDEVYYELRKFLELLVKNNPTMVELLHTPEDKVLFEHPLFQKIKNFNWLTKKCKNTFGNYAAAQIKKARGLNKKIVNPVGEERKSVLEFCYVTAGQGAMPVLKWLEQNELKQENCGLVNINHIQGLYAVFYDYSEELGYKGIIQKINSNQVSLSSIPKGELPLTHLYFNKDGYTKYCKDYREYWEWVEKRNEARYTNTISHGKNYDSKNMMHTFRLLNMAYEILSEGKVMVKRPNRTELLKIKSGDFEYDELLAKAEQQLQAIEAAYQTSKLPNDVNYEAVERLLIEVRMEFYQ